MPQVSGVAAYHNHPPQIPSPHSGILGSLSRQDIERMIQTPEGAAMVKMWMQGFLPPSDRSPGPSRTPSPDVIKQEPQDEEQYDDEPMELTTKRASSPESYESPLRCIQNMSVGSVSSGEQSPRSTGEDIEEDMKTPKVNSHGKVKLNKCRNCLFITPTKEEYWKHIIEHMNPDKILRCPSCPFVTEYKHHLEYHLNNHTGAKPYKCGECSYSCVNKSMLNSHLKSHSPVYQYRCQDCHYVTKYCHSFKQHLRKYKHTPLVVLNPDGTENPDTIIDVYGTRRGPKQKPMKQVNSASPTSPRENLLPRPNVPLAYNPFMMNPFMLPHLLGMFPGPFPGAMAMNLNMQDAQQQFEHKISFNVPPKHNDSLSPIRSESDNESVDDDSTVKNETLQNNNNVLNCRHCGISFVHRDMYMIHMSFHDSQNPFKCQKCSTVCKDSVDFFRHLTTVPH